MNRILAYVVTWVIFLIVFLLVVEGGLRLLGMGPQPTINTFDPKLGWVKKADITSSRSTAEFDVTYTINRLGLRDDENLTLEKPAGTKRILLLGDSFTLGYTVDRNHLFVDLLERAFAKEDREKKVQVINAGTEGYSSDQELLWLREEGLEFSPDIVVMNFYQNDVFWNSQDHYLRIPKPLFPEEGAATQPVQPLLEDPGEQGWFAGSTAVGKFFTGLFSPMPTFKTPGGKMIPMEWGVLLEEEPEFMTKAWNHTRAVLKGFKETCEARKIKPILALIPTKAQIYQVSKDEQARQLGLEDGQWNPNRPFQRMLEICKDIGLDVIDPSRAFSDAAMKNDADEKEELYFKKDRHFSPEGNKVFAEVLHRHLSMDHYLGQPKGPTAAIVLDDHVAGQASAEKGRALPTWLWVALSLWVILGLMYVYHYRDENGLLAFVKVGALIGFVVGLISLLNGLSALLPPGTGGLVFGLLFLAIIVFLLWKLRKRMGLILELYADFTNRGHWYMMPLLAVMLAIGSLLIVAASSPFVAPFIYTLF